MIDESSAARSPSPGADIWFVAVAASAGGLKALTELLSALPSDFNAAVAIVQHRVPEKEMHLQRLLSRHAALPVTMASDGVAVQGGNVYLASSESHLTVTADGRFSHEDGVRVHGLRSAANPLFVSGAHVYKDRMIAVVLTGSGSDGSEGVQEVSKKGGTVIAQDPATAEYTGMPDATVRTGRANRILPLSSIAGILVAIVGRTRSSAEVA